jgi:hypothetical protein
LHGSQDLSIDDGVVDAGDGLENGQANDGQYGTGQIHEPPYGAGRMSAGWASSAARPVPTKPGKRLKLHLLHRHPAYEKSAVGVNPGRSAIGGQTGLSTSILSSSKQLDLNDDE